MWKFSYSLHAQPDSDRAVRGQITKNRRLMATYHTFGKDGDQLPREPKSSSFVSYGGVALALLSGVISSCITSIPKYFVQIPPLEHALMRCFGIMVFSLPPLLYYQEISMIPKRQDLPVLLLRGMLLYVTNAFRIITVHSLQLSEVGVLMAIFPVYVSVFANEFSSQPFGPIQTVVLLINLVGIGFVTGLPRVLTESRYSASYMNNETIGISASLAAGLSFTLTGLLNAKMQHLPNRAIIFHSGVPGTLAGSAFVLMTREFSLPSCGIDSSLLMVLVLLVVIETVMQVFALKMEEKAPVSLYSSISMIACTCLWQITYSQIKLEWWTLLGIGLVVGSAVLTYLHLYISSLPTSRDGGLFGNKKEEEKIHEEKTTQ